MNDRYAADGISTAALLTAVVTASDDAIVSATVDGTVISWNGAAERLFGLRAGEAVGGPLHIIVPADRRGEHARLLERTVRGDTLSLRETRRLARDGQPRPMSLRMAPVRDDEGAVIGVVMVAHDIRPRQSGEREAFRQGAIVGASSIARAANDHRRTVQELSEASRQKDEFLAVLSHELRTPLNAIMGWADMLVSAKLDAASETRALAAIQRNARVQAQLIEDLLDISRIVAGKLSVNRDPVDVGAVVGAAIEDLQPEIAAKAINLRTSVDADANHVLGDAPRLQQVVSNLLNNAIKFTPRNGHIEVRLERRDDTAQITVCDDGQGIAPAFLEHVFDRFGQGDSSATRRHGGLGLGLGIVKHLVEAHGGTVTASSEGLGQGAAFTVCLPLQGEAVHEVQRDDAQAARDLPSLSGVEVLVVDDDPDAADLLRFALERCGARVAVEGSAVAALHAIGARRFMVILADIGMPNVDGYDLVRAIRTREARDDMPRTAAVAITAHAGPGDRDRALAAGFDWHLTKPVNPGEVVALVAQLTHQPPSDHSDSEAPGVHDAGPDT